MPTLSLAQNKSYSPSPLTVKQVIDTIPKEILNAPFASTVDQLRAGSLDQEVKGIVTIINPRLLTLPQPFTLKSIATLAKNKLGTATVRVVGNLKQNCTTVYLAFGYMDSKRQIAAILEFKPDVILSGATREWETVELVRDGLQMGQKTNLIILNHAVS